MNSVCYLIKKNPFIENVLLIPYKSLFFLNYTRMPNIWPAGDLFLLIGGQIQGHWL